MINSDSELEKRMQAISHAMSRGYMVYDPPEPPEYSLWTDIKSTIPELFKGSIEGGIDVATTVPSATGFYTPQDRWKSKPWYSVDANAGVIGSIAHGIGHFVGSFGTGFGLFAVAAANAPAAIAATTIGLASAGLASGTRTYKDLRDEGVDHETALKAGTISGGATYIGGKFAGVYGTSLIKKAFTGGSTNVLLGVGERQAIGGYLYHKGYGDLADHYSKLETAHIGAEFIIGAGLGAIHGKGNHPDIKPHEVDIAQAVKNDIDDIVTSSPGIPTTHQSAEIHARTLDRAILAMERGEEVRVDPVQMDLMLGDMVAKPELELSPEMRQLLKQAEEFVPKSREVKAPIAQDPLSPRIPEYERKLIELEQTFAHEPEIKEKITRDIELSKKEVFNAALNCLFGVK